MTKEVIERLDEKHKTFLSNRKNVMRKSDKPTDVKGEIRGYLRGIQDCGIISDTEFRVLYTYYTLV